VAENGSIFAVEDPYPVTQGHQLILPRSHVTDYFSMSQVEREFATQLLRVQKNRLQEEDSTITGFNVGMNCGDAAGQTVMHAHIHLIPRSKGVLLIREVKSGDASLRRWGIDLGGSCIVVYH